MHRNITAAAMVAAFLTGITAAQTKATQQPADTIYENGDIVTVNPSQSTAEALAVADGKILFVGKRADAAAYKGKSTVVVDLHGKTLLPGFVDGHSHFAALIGGWGIPNLGPPPIGPVTDIADIQRIMRENIEKNRIPKNDFVYGFGYDDSQLAEHRHPMRADLDAITTDHPLCLQHVSGHLAACNTAALELLGIKKDAPDPQGGKIFHDPATGELTGVLGDAAAAPVAKLIKPASMAKLEQAFPEVQNYYAAFGYTTAQDGAETDEQLIRLMQSENKSGGMKIDVIVYPTLARTQTFIDKEAITISRDYTGHLKFPGVKLFSDGSPQGKTAYLTQPYLKPPAGSGADYRGFPTVPQAELDREYAFAFSRNWQVITHANGDAAIDMVLTALDKAEKTYGSEDRRPVIIHSQIVRKDQLDRYGALHIFPSYFEAHTFYWGDWHRQETLGPERAAFISPLHSSLDRGILFSIHSDAPIVPPNPMTLWWSAVTRLTRTNYVLGPSERIDAMTALKALTIWPAYQQFDEKIKGTLEPGKYADLVILQENPLKADPLHIKDIKVVETIKQGKTIWKQ